MNPRERSFEVAGVTEVSDDAPSGGPFSRATRIESPSGGSLARRDCGWPLAPVPFLVQKVECARESSSSRSTCNQPAWAPGRTFPRGQPHAAERRPHPRRQPRRANVAAHRRIRSSCIASIARRVSCAPGPSIRYDALTLAEHPTTADPDIKARLLAEAWLERGPRATTNNCSGACGLPAVRRRLNELLDTAARSASRARRPAARPVGCRRTLPAPSTARRRNRFSSPAAGAFDSTTAKTAVRAPRSSCRSYSAWRKRPASVPDGRRSSFRCSRRMDGRFR